MPQKNNDHLTIVTGFWDLNRSDRSKEFYLERFKHTLSIEQNMVVFVPKELESFVTEHRKNKNTVIKIYELEDIKNLFSPFWDKVQQIRTDSDWLNITGESGWLKNSPQATLEYYNPIVMSKMFLMHECVCWNYFDTDYYLWIDAGLPNTVDKNLLNEDFFNKIEKHLYPFLFLSYPYKTTTEIHGFKKEGMDSIAGVNVEYVCRGGMFGGHKDIIREANSSYYSFLMNSLNRNFMGTEESIFTLMTHVSPEKYNRYSLDSNGLIIKFVKAVHNDEVVFEEIPEERKNYIPIHLDVSKIKTSLYMLTFNFPEQVRHTLETYSKHPEWLKMPNKYLIDNSTNDEAREGNKNICEEFGFEHIVTNDNLGINRGRFLAAQHFDKTDSDYYIFLEDDMGLYPPEINFCRNGLRTYVPNLLRKIQKIMLREKFDFLKLSFAEVYMDNFMQCSWYNVPQNVRTKVWPHYDKLPITGMDSNCPRTVFTGIDRVEDLLYIKGEAYYDNWPLIFSKDGNRKVFLETVWEYPFEQTWMSYVFQKQLEGHINSAVLLASPIHHNRIAHYTGEERKEC